ncbi:hypothetical protein GCM10022252_09470 [Streptosporangium oxazolinicum]|uniref:DUF1349 domain-containing protein n=1 Tax=Streptosporangium oxazolinicum TaxID=909287 RepID=A0ABP8AF18_9ACTN
MRETSRTTAEPPLTARVRQEWGKFRTRGRMTAMAAAILVTVLFGLLSAIALGAGSHCSHGPVEVPCPTDPVGPHGQAVSDTFYFAHQPLGENGSITVRMTSMTGIITYPPPDHDEIVPGLVPWAKAGIIIKDGTTQGSSYAALMLTGSHGVRMQHDYTHDTAGRAGGVSAETPRWLRLTRSGDTITGHESADGTRWTKVGTAHLTALPETVRVGLFAASPGDLTLTPVALGGSLPASRFTQASATFDHVSVEGGTPSAEWSRGSVGEMGHTDWERYHRAAGLVESNGTFTVTGTGDIGPAGTAGGRPVESTLVGLVISLIIVLVVAVRFTTAEDRPGGTGTEPPMTAGYRSGETGAEPLMTAEDRPGGSDAEPLTRRTLAAKALVIGAVTFLAGLVSAAVMVPVGPALLRANGLGVSPAPALTGLRVVVGVAAMLAVAAVLALALGALLRRTWTAILLTITVVVLPYLLAALPLLPDETARWLLRVTPAAGFAVKQTLPEYPQVVAHYAPSAGYYPLAWWAGLAVLCGYTAVVFALARSRLRHLT